MLNDTITKFSLLSAQIKSLKMSIQPRRTQANYIAKGDDWNNILQANCVLNSCKLSTANSIDLKNSNKNDASESNGQEKNISKVLSNIFRKNRRDSKNSGDLIENFPSTECSNSTFFRFRYRGTYNFSLKDLSRPFKSLDTMDCSRKNGIANFRRLSLSNLNNGNEYDLDDLDVARTGLNDKSEMDATTTSCNDTNQGVRHVALNPGQLEIFKKFSKPSLSKSHNLVRERACDINNEDIESRRNASLRLALNLAEDDVSSNCSDVEETLKKNI